MYYLIRLDLITLLKLEGKLCFDSIKLDFSDNLQNLLNTELMQLQNKFYVVKNCKSTVTFRVLDIII